MAAKNNTDYLTERQDDAFRLVNGKWGDYLRELCSDASMCLYAVGNDIFSYTQVFGTWLERRGRDTSGASIRIYRKRPMGMVSHQYSGRAVFCLDQMKSERHLRIIGEEIAKNWESQNVRAFSYAWLNPVNEEQWEDYHDLESLRKRLEELI